MNKPAYAAIQTHSPYKPVIVFVSSRRQTRLTALDLIAFAAADQRAHQWVHMDQEILEDAIQSSKVVCPQCSVSSAKIEPTTCILYTF